MNDADEAAFDGGSTDWVRDLLAEVRATGPVPDDVAARLDATLSRLQAERQGERQGDRPGDRPGDDAHPVHAPGPAVVVPLRRRLAPLLAAAAVVVVIGGVAVGQLVSGGSGGSSGSSAADSAGTSSGLTTQPGGPQSIAPERAPGAQKGAGQALPQLTAGSFAQDVARVMQSLSAGTSIAGGVPSPGGSGDSLDQMSTPKATRTAPPVTAAPGGTAASAGTVAPGCPGPAVPGAVTLPAMLDGTPVALVFRPPTASAQEVEAWSCDGTTRLAAASVPH